MAKVLSSLDGRRLGLDNNGDLVMDGRVAVRKPASTHVGSTPASTISVREGGGALRRTVLTLIATPIAVTDDAGVAQYGGVQIFDFPAGLIYVGGAVVSGNLTGYASLIDTFDGDVALGTATATTGATLTGTEADIMQSNAITQAVGEVAAVDAVTAATALTESGARWFDGTATATNMFLNFVIDDNAAHGAGTANFTGTVEFLWANIGDN